jgi:hypothetical protein
MSDITVPDFRLDQHSRALIALLLGFVFAAVAARRAEPRMPCKVHEGNLTTQNAVSGR